MGRRSEGSGQVGAAKEVDATPLFAALDPHPAKVAGIAQGVGITSCSAIDWPAELDGGPGGSDILSHEFSLNCWVRDGGEYSTWVCTLICTW